MRAFAIRSRIKPPHMGLVSQFVIVLLVVALMGAMAIEPVRQMLEQRELIGGMKSELNEVERSNTELRERIRRLNDADFIEQRAREQIGLVRPGEIPFVVMPAGESAKSKRKQNKKEKKDAAAEAEAKAPAAKAPAEDEPGFVENVLNFIGF